MKGFFHNSQRRTLPGAMVTGCALTMVFSLSSLAQNTEVARDAQVAPDPSVPGEDAAPKSVPSLGEMRQNVKTGETPYPSPFDAFMALDLLSKDNAVDWGAILADSDIATDPDSASNPVAAALMLGVKVSDGLIAIKARDVEALNDISSVIERLAKTLGVEPEILERAERVREMATDGDWLAVFLELGFLQENIIEALNKDDRKDQRALILAAGWVRGADHAARAIASRYSPAASNILREPVLVGQLIKDLEATSEEVRGNATVKQFLAALPEVRDLCNIPQTGQLSEQQVARIQEISGALSAAAAGAPTGQ